MSRTNYKHILTLLTLLLLFYSFQSLVTDSFLVYADINLHNYLSSPEIIVISLLIITVFTSWKLHFTKILFIIFIIPIQVNYDLVLCLLLITYVTVQLNSISHKIITTFLFLSTQTYFKSVLIITINRIFPNYYYSLINLDIYSVKAIITKYAITDMSFISSLNGIETLQWLFKLLSNSWVIQLLQNGVLNLKTSIYIFESEHTTLLATFFLSIFIFFSIKTSNIKITH